MSTPERRAVPSSALRFVALAVTAAGTALAAPCAAQSQRPSRDEATEQDAREHFQTGVQLYEEQNYDGALAEFEESFRLRPVPIVMFNIAQSQRELRRYAEAIDSFGRYLELAGPQLAPERRTAVAATIDQLRRSIGNVTVETDPPGAELRIDGRAAGTTPRRNIPLAAGRHVVELMAEGAVPVREEITVVARRDRLVRFGLAVRFRASELAVVSATPNATVLIDGNDLGPPPVTRQVTAGGHRVEVRAPGFAPHVSEVVLAERQQRTVRATLDRPGGIATRWWFWTTIGVVVTGAVVAGVLIGTQAAAPEPTCGTGTPCVIQAATWR